MAGPSSRASIARSSQHSSRARSTKGSDEEAWPPAEPDARIVDIINELVEHQLFTIRDLHQPSPQQVWTVYEAIVATLTGTTREVMAPVMKAAAEDVHGAEPETDILFSSDCRDYMGFFVVMRRVMETCLVTDFSMNDLLRPDSKRFKKIFLSALNFIRFKENQSTHIDKNLDKMHEIQERAEALDEKRRELVKELQHRQETDAESKRLLAEKEATVAEMGPKVLARVQAMLELKEQYAEETSEKTRLRALGRERRNEAITAQNEAAKLKPYTEQTPAVLESELKQLESRLKDDEVEMHRIVRRSRGLQTSADTFIALEAEVAELASLLRDVQAEIKREEETLKETRQNKALITERSMHITEIARKESQLKKTLQIWQQRTRDLQQTTKDKSAEMQARQVELRAAYKELSTEKRNKGEDIDIARMRIERMEKKKDDLRAELEEEVKAARQQYAALESHVTMYMNEMSQVMIC